MHICTIYIKIILTIRLLLAPCWYWPVPDDDEPVGPSEEGELTAAKAAYKAELLGELQDRKTIKDARLQEKREIEEEIRSLQVRMRPCTKPDLICPIRFAR
jgi:hypothetical protein